MTIDLKSTGAIPAGVRAALGLPYSVMVYGAVGDGVADDTAAIEAAYDAAFAAGGGTVFLPDGIYKITSTLTFASTRISLIGATRGNTVINYTGSGVAIDITADGYMRMGPFTLNNAGTGTYGIVVGTSAAYTGVWYELDRITVNDFATAGFRFANCELGRFYGLHAADCGVGFLADNSRHSGGALGGWNKWENCRASDSTGRGWDISSQAAGLFDQCESLRSGGAEQFYIAGTSRNCRVVNADVETASLGTTIGLSIGGTEHVVSVSAFSLATGIQLRSNATKCKVEASKFSSVTEPLEIDAACTDIIVEDIGNLTGSTFGLPSEVTFLGGRGAPVRTAVYLPGSSGNYISTPDHADLDITGDVEMVWHGSLDDWTPAAETALVGKYNTVGLGRGYLLSVATNGKITTRTSVDGTAAVISASTVAPSLTNGTRYWVKATVDVDNGATGNTVTFYMAADQLEEPTTWTQIGDPVVNAGTTSIFVGTSPVEVGGINAGTTFNLAGQALRAIIRAGIAGTLVADWRGDAPMGTRYRDATGKVWTANGSAWSWMRAV